MMNGDGGDGDGDGDDDDDDDDDDDELESLIALGLMIRTTSRWWVRHTAGRCAARCAPG